jgi:pimeloyl-ACP methyl ester carboxylesterase
VDEAARRRGIRVIAFDRPGFGLSDFKPGRTIGDWPDDVVQAAAAFGFDRFAILGLSFGGPHALACALRIPERLTTVAIVSSVGPFQAPGATDGMGPSLRVLLGSIRRFSGTARVAMWLATQVTRRAPAQFNWLQSRGAAQADQAVTASPSFKAYAARHVSEVFRQGSRGPAHELVLVVRPWGFRPEDIAMEVQLWQGEADVMVPPSMGRYLSEALPNCRARFCPGEGHLMLIEHMDEILSALFPSPG